MTKSLTNKEIQRQFENLNDLMIQEWLNDFVFSVEWWLLLVLTIVPWFLWWRMVDKSRIVEILVYGLLIVIISTFFDVLGWSYSFWFYPYTLLGTCTPLVPIDYTLLPIFYMMLYQFYSKWKRFTIRLVMLACIFAFVLEPLAEVLHFYKPIKWYHIYSILGYVAIGVFSKWLVEKILKVQQEGNYIKR